jgi:tetratricopeptide (TPR) repeat protein
MRHAAFFEALAEAREGDSAWELATVGYFIVRCLDDWHMLGGAQLAVDGDVERVRKKIEALGMGEARYAHVFREALLVLGNSPVTNVATVVAPLLAYASLLETDSRWALAADVYDTIADVLSDSKLSDTTNTVTQGFARRREAFARRNIGEFDRAEVRYRQAIIISEQAEDFQNIHLCRIGLANLSRVRGNLPASLATLTELLGEWESGSYPQIENALADILQTRGTVLHEMGDYDGAIRDFFGAYRASRDQSARNFILNDMAACAIRTGYYGFAHDALELMLRRTDVQRLRQFAIINLIYLSIAQDDEIAFVKYRTQLKPDVHDVSMNATALLIMAQGVEQFGTKKEALLAYQEAEQFATENRISKVQFDAITHIDRLQQVVPANNNSIPAPATIPSSLWAVADALSHEYQLAVARGED